MPIRRSLRNRLRLLRSLGLAAALLAAPHVRAEEPLRVAQAPPPPEDQQSSGGSEASTGVEEIVVKGAESAAVQDFNVADSVTAFSAADLVALGATNIADLAAFTPNLEIVTAGSTTPTFFIRGVGLNDFGANSTGSVAIYQDDVAMNSQALQLGTLYDMESVNVLRGPQGTGLARNSSAGAIKLYARKPTGQYNGYLRADGGSYNFQYYEGAVEAPVYEDMLSARLAFVYQDRDGTMRNRCANAPPFSERTPTLTRKLLPPFAICGESVLRGPDNPGDVSNIPMGLPKYMNDRHNWAGRGSLLFEPTLETSFLFNAHGTRRNELSRLGQSYGTNGIYCLNGNYANCPSGNPGFYPRGGVVTGLLGGNQGTSGYLTPEVRHRLTELIPCFQYGIPQTQLPPSQQCPTSILNFQTPDGQAIDAARQQVARELSRDLDDRPWEGDFNRAGPTVNDTWGVMLKGEYLLPFDLDLNTVTGYDRYQRKIDVDLDFSPETLFQIFTRDHGRQFYQDVKLSGENELLPDSPVRWDFGGWALREALNAKVTVDLGSLSPFGVGHRRYDQDLIGYGAYGAFEFDFWDDFTLDGGARFNWENKDIDYTLALGDPPSFFALNERDTWRAPTGTIRLTYRFREDTHVYWKYNRGWKPGHYNATGSPVTGITVAKPETIDSFETGVRADWFNGVLSGDASLFYYNYTNYQIFTAQQYAGAAPEFVVINANDAEVYGAEIDALIRPWAGGYVNVRFGWLETQFLDFLLLQQATISRQGNPVIINRELQNSGNPLLNSPQFKVSLVAEQAIPIWHYGFIIPRWDGTWTDDTFYDATKGRGLPNSANIQPLPRGTIAQHDYWMHNVRLAYRTPDGRFEIAGWVRNLENTPVKTYSFDGSTFQNTTIHFVGDPRTYGVTAQFTF
jgi:outer membrane receptor protein involved in Fe transport